MKEISEDIQQLLKTIVTHCDQITIAWVAGLLEGEGCFAWDAKSPIIKLAMTDLDIVNRVKLITQCNGNVYTQAKKSAYHKDLYVIKLYGRQAIVWMYLIRSFMGERRGSVIDNIIASYIPAYKQGDGKCKRGHDTNNPANYYLNLSGSKTCKLCLEITSNKRKMRIIS